MWSLTWREFSALKRVWKDSRDHVNTLYAGLQATMHNHWFRSKDFHPQPWTIEDFMPGRKPKPEEADPWEPIRNQDWKANRMIIGMMLHAASEHNAQHGAN